MMTPEDIKNIAVEGACEYLNTVSLEDYHIDINIFTYTDNPMASMYVVHIYPEFPDRDVLQILITCMTGEILAIDYSERVYG